MFILLLLSLDLLCNFVELSDGGIYILGNLIGWVDGNVNWIVVFGSLVGWFDGTYVFNFAL